MIRKLGLGLFVVGSVWGLGAQGVSAGDWHHRGHGQSGHHNVAPRSFRGGLGHSYQRLARPSHTDWHDTSHVDYHAGSYVRHRGYSDYTPGYYDVHKQARWDVH